MRNRPEVNFNDFSEFDLASALYHWLQHNWQGQNDPLYADFCRLTDDGMYRPSRSEEFFDNISEDARYIYYYLTRDNYKTAFNRVLNYESSDRVIYEDL